MIYGILALAIVGAGFALFTLGKTTAEKNDAKKDLENAKGEAQEHADMPLTPFDFAARMRERIKRKSKT